MSCLIILMTGIRGAFLHLLLQIQNFMFRRYIDPKYTTTEITLFGKNLISVNTEAALWAETAQSRRGRLSFEPEGRPHIWPQDSQFGYMLTI
jgi:hypothetical protein